MKNFHLKYGHCNNIIFPKIFSFESFRPLPCYELDSLLKISPGIYPQSYHKSNVLQYFFVRTSRKKENRGWIISNFRKGEIFSRLISTKLS